MELARHSDEAHAGSVVLPDAGPQGSATATGQGARAVAPPQLDPQPSTEVLKVPNARILQSVLYAGPSAVLLPGVPVLAVSLALGVPGMVAWLGPTLLATGGAQLKRLTRESNFTLYHQGDRLLIRHGLTDLRTTSVPLHRIQAIKVSQSLPWRLPGWWRVEVNIAGASHDDDTTQTVVMPVGTLDEAVAVLRLVRPGIPADAARAALVGPGGEPGFVAAGAGARRLDPFAWRRLGYAVLPDCLMTRRGRLYRAAEFVPHARIQSLAVRQGPLQRSQGLATVRIVSTPGPVSPQVQHLDVHEAERLVNEQVERSSRARRRA
jgi:putative membrane protein